MSDLFGPDRSAPKFNSLPNPDALDDFPAHARPWTKRHGRTEQLDLLADGEWHEVSVGVGRDFPSRWSLESACAVYRTNRKMRVSLRHDTETPETANTFSIRITERKKPSK